MSAQTFYIYAVSIKKENLFLKKLIHSERNYDMKEHVKRIDRKLLRHGTILDIYTDTMLLPDGRTEQWDFISHRLGAAAVVPVLDDGKIVMVHQYRNALERMTLEIPAGSRDSREEPTIVCAARELAEETGYHSDELSFLISLRTTVAFCDEFIDVYLARNLKPGEQHLDAGESIDAEAFELQELLDMIYSGKIQDSKTVSSILAYQNLLLTGKIPQPGKAD